MKYRKKPVVIEAIQLTGTRENADEVSRFITAPHGCGKKGDGFEFRIQTLEGVMTAVPGDWIIKGVAGEFYPCRSDIFELTYEAVEE